MLFWIFLAVFVVGVVFAIIYANTNVGEWANWVGLTCAITAGLAVIISIICLCSSYIGLDGYIAANQVRYDSLTYQYENDIYNNDNDLGKKELMLEIQDWNEDLANYREIQDDFWVGIYYPDVYDQFDFIELE